MKTCTECFLEKELSLFNKQKLGKFGVESKCKQCRSNRQKRNRANDPEKFSEMDKRNRLKNLDKIKEKDRKCRKKAREDRPEIIKAQKRKSYEKTKPSILKRNREYVKKRSSIDPSFKLSLVLRSRLTMAIKGGAKKGSAVKDLGCTIDYFKTYIESLFYPHPITGEKMIWEKWGKGVGKWQIDHKEPMCLFDFNDRAQLLIACHYTNLQPLWSEDHVIKSIADGKRSRHANT